MKEQNTKKNNKKKIKKREIFRDTERFREIKEKKIS